MTAWYRSGPGGSRAVHIQNCAYAGRSQPWAMVEGWGRDAVLAHIGGVPWLRLCVYCADRLQLAADHPARHTGADAPA